MIVIEIIDIILYIIFGINILYIFIFALASRITIKKTKKKAIIRDNKFAILIPAYKEDSVILECVESCINQDYDKSNYDIVVISDKMNDNTNLILENKGIILHKVTFEKSTKAKSLNFSLNLLDNYDYALILDADNVIKPNYLTRLNQEFENSEYQIIQTHRIAKNLNNNMAYLDAVSEEINNSIFRLGHVNIGFSAALIGSGMAFEFQLLKSELKKINAIGGFDRALELTMFKLKKKIGYVGDWFWYKQNKAIQFFNILTLTIWWEIFVEKKNVIL